MLSFFSEPCLKESVVARVKEHQRLDEIVHGTGTYWDGVRGCAIGCVLHSSEHIAYETQLGLPVFLAFMDEHIFEALPPQEAVLWPLRFIEAVPVGVNLELVFPRFIHWLLTDPDGVRTHADARTLPIIDTLAAMYARRIEGVPFDAEEAAGVARVAWVACDGAGMAAGVARVAWMVARVAWMVARVAWMVARVEAARVAWVAAAEAAGAAREAAGVADWEACIHRQADMLITILQSYEPAPVLVYAPCDEQLQGGMTRAVKKRYDVVELVGPND